MKWRDKIFSHITTKPERVKWTLTDSSRTLSRPRDEKTGGNRQRDKWKQRQMKAEKDRMTGRLN